MAFVTRLRLTSGDRETLDRVAADIKESAERKGVKLTGPHSRPSTNYSVPQYRRSPPGVTRPLPSGDADTDTPTPADVDPDDGEFSPWRYTVYERELEIVGREEFVRDVTDRELPASVRMAVSVDRTADTGAGGR